MRPSGGVERSISLSAGEWRIMERLWDRHPQTLTELVRALGADTGCRPGIPSGWGCS